MRLPLRGPISPGIGIGEKTTASGVGCREQVPHMDCCERFNLPREINWKATYSYWQVQARPVELGQASPGGGEITEEVME
jgi:hypothetical protein